MFDTPPRSILIAPDKFKGCLSAVEVASAIARGLHRACPDARLLEHPIADGGEGTVQMVLRQGFRPVVVQVSGPVGGRVSATIAIRDDTAVIEMASAAGLALLGEVGPSPESALRATTYGVGELISAALDHGARRIVVGMGGSATTDGGAGAVQALGALVIDSTGRAVGLGGIELTRAHGLDLCGLDRRVTMQAEIAVACDVEVHLTGASGAAETFSPQKGADPDTVALLERAMGVWAGVVHEATGRDLRDRPGAGAAGGLAFGLASVLGAMIVPGIDVLLDISGFSQAVAGCDLVIVGEGSLDAQSLLGKGPVGVARRAADLGVPSVAVVGRSLVTEDEARRAGLDAVIALTDHMDKKRSKSQTAAAVEEVVANALPSVVGWPARSGRANSA